MCLTGTFHAFCISRCDSDGLIIHHLSATLYTSTCITLFPCCLQMPCAWYNPAVKDYMHLYFSHVLCFHVLHTHMLRSHILRSNFCIFPDATYAVQARAVKAYSNMQEANHLAFRQGDLIRVRALYFCKFTLLLLHEIG